MEKDEILETLNRNYPMKFTSAEFLRDSGSVAYEVFTGEEKYFLRITKPTFALTAGSSLDVHVFLQQNNFPVPKIIQTINGAYCVECEAGKSLFVLCEFIEGGEVDPLGDAEKIGELCGKLHSVMKNYRGQLVKRDRYYYIDKYLEQMRAKNYPKVGDFERLGNELWERVKELPMGYCHGDLYCGNFHKTPEGKIYVLDFDTSCIGFPMYDPVVICDATDFFSLKEGDAQKSREILKKFLPRYLKQTKLSSREIDSFYDLVSVYHFALQATIIDIFGLDCVDNEFLDNQLDWLNKWQEQVNNLGKD